MKTRFIWLFLIWYLILGSPAIWAATITVNPGESIQDAIDTASIDDVIEVNAGTYTENINFKGKQITVRSTAGPETTIIDGGDSGPVVTFNSWEQGETILEGFTIKNGVGKKIDGLDYGFGGGILCRGSSPTIKDNIIEQNRADPFTGDLFGLGGGICIIDHASPDVTLNIIRNNQAELGGGIYIDKTNDPDENGLTDTIIVNNLIYLNTGKLGGGIFVCGSSTPQIVNNTIADNVAEVEGGGIWIDGYTSIPSIVSTILWGNGDDIYGADSSMMSYCDIEDGDFNNLNRNMSQDPQFVGSGNYHLLFDSPCIDAGDPSSDFSDEPDPAGCRINMGVYGNTLEATISSDSDGDEFYGACDNCPLNTNPMQEDIGDNDGAGDACDNCPNTPNGPDAGTCICGNKGDPCDSNDDCGDCGFCSMNQEDTDSDGLGDVCDESLCQLYLCRYECCVGKRDAGRTIDKDECWALTKSGSSACNSAGCYWEVDKGMCLIDICLGDTDMDGYVSGGDGAQVDRDYGRGDCPCAASGDLCERYEDMYACCFDLAAAGRTMDKDVCWALTKSGSSACNGAGCYWDVGKGMCLIDICLGDVSMDTFVAGGDGAQVDRDYGRSGCQ